MNFKITFLAVVLALIVASSANAQVQYGRTYRVIAYKKGDLSIYSTSNEIVVIPSMSLYIPNTFTPNGDGINDTFGVSGEAVKEFDMKVYDRWGALVFETDNTNTQWDGSVNGKKPVTGTYIYKITATGPVGGRETHNGQVNIIM